MDGTVYDQLLSYIQRGWALVPLHDVSSGACSCQQGEACRSAGKHPRWKDWEQDPNQIRTAERLLPLGPRVELWNWGVATGTASGVWVLDIDQAGMNEYNNWAEKRGVGWTQTLAARTGSGGLHLYFALPDDGGPIPRNVSRRQRAEGLLPPGIDVRGDGGQAVLPPSVSAKGPYSWLNWGSPIIQAPAWLLSLVRGPQSVERPVDRVAGVMGVPGEVTASHAGRGPAYAATAVAALVEELRRAPDGTRNDAAYRVACRLMELVNAPWSGLDVNQVYGAWFAAGQDHPDGVYVPPGELDGIWGSARRHVGLKEAELPPSVLVSEPLPLSLAPWAGSASTSVSASPGPGGSDPFTDPGNPRGLSTDQVGNSRGFEVPADPVEAAVVAEMQRQWLRDEARRRLAAVAGGPLADRLGTMRAKLLDRDTLAALPAPEWLVPGFLQLDSLARIVGAPGHGKSFVSFDLAAHLGAGLAWGGRDVAEGETLYVVGESLREYVVRQAAWEAHHGRQIKGVSWYPEPVQVGDAPAWDALVALVAERRPALIVLDTQARITVGINENDATEIGALVDACERLRLASGACVLLVHHTPLGADRARGNGAALGAMTSELLARKEGRVIELSILKQKGAPEDDVVRFELRDVYGQGATDSDGMTAPGELIGVVPAVVRDGAPARTTVHVITDEELTGYAGAVALIAREVFAGGVGGTKAEYANVVLKEREIVDHRSTFYRVWGELLKRRIIGKVRGTSSFRYIPVEERDQLIEPIVGDKANAAGFYAP